MLRRLTANRSFHIGTMFHDSAAAHGDTRVVLDEPLLLAPDGGTEYTVPRLAAKIDELTESLARAGVQARQRIAIYKTDNVDIVLLACAVSRLGAVPALLSPFLPGKLIPELLQRLDNPWLLTDAEKIATEWDGHLPDVPLRGTLLSAGNHPVATTLVPVPGARERKPVLLDPSENAVITHSSGTTGVPKLAVHTPNTLWNRLVPQKLMARPIRGREPAFLCMTFVHSRFYNALRVFLDHGNTIVLARKQEPEAAGPLLAATRPGYVETHPNTYIEWEKLVDADTAPLGSIKIFGGTFDAMHPRTIQRLLDASQRKHPLFFLLYGQSETGPVTARWFTRRGIRKGDTRNVGIPLPGFTAVRVTGPDGKPLPRRATGHIEARVRSRIVTYFGEDERYAKELNDGWWRMGDMGTVDRLGRVFLLDREIDQIETVSSNLGAEDVLMQRMTELREVAIVQGGDGRPVPVVCTQDEQPLDRDRWQHATEDLDPMAEPIQLPFDDVPRTSTKKVQRPELARMLRESR